MPIGKILTQPAELNFNLVWSKVPMSVKGAFVEHNPRKVKLPKGFQLYKYTEFTSLVSPGNGKISEWWSPVNFYGMDPGLDSRKSLARRLGVSVSALTRVMSAVNENWNGLKYQVKTELNKPVYAFWGQCKMQNRRDNKNTRAIETGKARTDMKPVTTEKLPGYGWQFYIPNLRIEHIKVIGSPERDF
mgnify:FL=1